MSMGVNFNPGNFSNYNEFEQQTQVVKTTYNQLPSDETAIVILNREEQPTNRTDNPELMTELNEYASAEVRWEAAKINEDYFKDYFGNIDWEAQGYELMGENADEPYLVKRNYNEDGTLASTDFLKAVDKITDYTFIEGNRDAVEHMLIHTSIAQGSSTSQIDVMYAQDPNTYDANDWASTKFAKVEFENLKKYNVENQYTYKVVNDRQLERTLSEEGKDTTYLTTVNDNGEVDYDLILRELDKTTNTTTSYTYNDSGAYKTISDDQGNMIKQSQVMYDVNGNTMDYDTARNGVVLNHGIVGVFDNPSGEAGSIDTGYWTYEYDAQGRVLSEHTSQGIQDGSDRIEYTYNADGEVASKTISSLYLGEPTAEGYKGFEETTLYDNQGASAGRNIVKKYDKFNEVFSLDKNDKGTYKKLDLNGKIMAQYNIHLDNQGAIIIEAQ